MALSYLMLKSLFCSYHHTCLRDYTVQLSGFSHHLLLGDQLALNIFANSGCKVLARAECS